MSLPQLESMANQSAEEDYPGLLQLVQYLQKEYESQLKTYEEMKKKGLITFGMLRMLFVPTTKIVAFQSKKPEAFSIPILN